MGKGFRLLLAFLVFALFVPQLAFGATLTRTTLTRAGASVLAAGLTTADAAGDKCPADEDTFVAITNSSASNTYTVTWAAQTTAYGLTVTAPTTSIAVSSGTVVGPFPAGAFQDSGGYLNWAYTGTAPATDLKVKCFHLPD